MYKVQRHSERSLDQSSWTPESLKRIGDACGGFIAIDKSTAIRTEVLWARLLIKLTRNLGQALSIY